MPRNINEAPIRDLEYLVGHDANGRGGRLQVEVFRDALVQQVSDEIALPELTAANVTYAGTNVQAILDQLLYVPLVASSFTSTPAGPVEIGQSITGLTLDWAYTGGNPLVSQSIAPGVGALSVGSRSTAIAGSITANTTWTLTANDGINVVNRSYTLNFRHRRRWGLVSAAPTNSVGILALTDSEFATARPTSKTFTAASAMRLCYAYPQAWGDPTSTRTNGFMDTAYTVTTVSFTNASGNTSMYNVVTKDTPIVGQFTWELL